MKTAIQLKIKELIDNIEFNGNPLFDTSVVNYRKEEDDSESNNETNHTGAVIFLKEIGFGRKGIHKQMKQTLSDGFIMMIFKKTHPQYDDIIEKGPILVAQGIYDNPTLDKLVNECYPISINWELYRAETIGVFTMAEFRFRVESKFFVSE